MRKSGRLVALGALLFMASVARGDPPPIPDLIEITDSIVYRWNINSPGHIYLRETGTKSFGDLTYTNDGRYIAYRTSYQGATPALFSIDPQTGVASLVVQSTAGAGDVIATAPMPSGHLFAYDNWLGFVDINPTTLAYTRVSITVPGLTLSVVSGAMATSPSGNLYAWCNVVNSSSTSFSGLFQIDPTTASGQLVAGFTGLPNEGFDAMSFTPDGRLFACTGVNVLAGGHFLADSIYQLDLQGGDPLFAGQRLELAGVGGIAFLVPEPGSPVLLMIGASLILRRDRRMRID